jgi:hypothetical protein
MSALLVVLLLAAEKSGDADVSVDTVTVNGEPTTTSKASGAAATASATGQQWSVVTARTVGQGANALQGGVGFPGVHAQLLHGMTQALDLGGRVSFNYGLEGQVACSSRICVGGDALPPGVKLQAVARYKFFDNGKLNAGAAFSPGLLLYFPRFVGTQVGFALPVSATLGIVASSAMNVGITVELPMWVLFGQRSGFVLPVLMGAGFEYFITSALAVWFDLRMGPSIWTNGVAAAFTFDGKLGVGWRF